MSARKPIAVGTKFHRWTVIGDQLPWDGKPSRVPCRCECGKERAVLSVSLRKGISLSCGCFSAESTGNRSRKHGHSFSSAGKRQRTRTYRIWCAMISRCENQKTPMYKHYGGRGIKICTAWRASFEAFLRDMGECPPGLSIDRLDNDGNYQPENCRWASALEQAQHTSRSRYLEFEGQMKTISEWSRVTGINALTIYNRLKRGWSIQRALTEAPIGSKCA
jgi:hypothetical protein